VPNPYLAQWFSVRADYRRGYVETCFHDGTMCVGSHEGNDPEQYAETARRAGYGDDVRRMACHNDLLHSWLAERAGLPFSPALWGTAHQRWYPGWEAEESVVFGLQCLLHGGQLSDWHMLAVARYIKWLRPKTTLTPLVAEARAWLAQFEPG
jgi:hypothetical protein